MTINRLSTSVLSLVVVAAGSIAAEAQDTVPQYLIGYREYRTNLSGGRHANDATSRAYVVGADGTGRRPLAPELVTNADTGSTFVGWSPDGRAAIISVSYNSPDNAAWEEAHRSFRFAERASDCYLLDLASGQTINVSSPERMSDVNQGVSYWPGNPQKLLGDAMINGVNHPVSMDLDGRNKRDLIGNSAAYTYGAQVSPDGKRIAYHSDYQVYIADADGSNPLHIDTGNSFNFMPKWSPDGLWVMFLSGEHYNCHPYVVQSDGAGLRKVADRQGHSGVVPCFDVPDFHGGSSDVPVWSPDGLRIYYTALVGKSLELMQTTLDGNTMQLTRSVTPGTLNYLPTPSPDGEWIMFGSNSSGTRQLYIMSAEGGPARAITNVPPGYGAMFGKWSPVPIPKP